MSLSLTRVRVSDGGKYSCYIPLINIKAEVTLLVVSVAPPSMSLIKERSGSPVLRCESRGWYPEPELEWLDSEGTVLLRTEAQRGASEELFSVSSRLSVEQRLGNTFTCRVRQQESGQSREAQLSITDNLLEPCPSCSLSWILFSLSLVLFLAAVAVLVVWKCKTKRKKSDSKRIELGEKEERESMMKKGEILNLLKQKTETELRYVNDVINRLTVEKNVLMKLKENSQGAIHNQKIVIDAEAKREVPIVSLNRDKLKEQQKQNIETLERKGGV
ncbi:hypothetical protein NQD34_013460 [Periophthalmus magnuspinnatus]|nr:hypothetical protein NQD34_013460 [Periophthalmus magnuspinnatus]